MFLNRLTVKEKIAFLELAHHVARSDSDFSEDQKSIIGKYCMEMQIDDIKYEEEKFDIYSTLGAIEGRASRKIVVLEIMALIYADNFLHEAERKVLEKILEEFELSYHIAIIYTEWAKTMISLYRQGSALIEL